MRPVNKGKSPSVNFSRYRDAEPYLEKRLGRYCSYCEMPIFNLILQEVSRLFRR